MNSQPSLACGVDVVHIPTMADLINSGSDSFPDMCWTAQELNDCHGSPSMLAARWAVKEAVMKVLGQGLGELDPNDIEVRAAPGTGVPNVTLHHAAAKRARVLGIENMTVSMSHDNGYAIAFAAAHRNAPSTHPVPTRN